MSGYNCRTSALCDSSGKFLPVNETQINRICKTFEYVLQIMSVSRFTKIKDIDLIDQDEKIYLLETLNSTKSDFSSDKSILDLFEDQVAKNPNALALIFKDTKLNIQIKRYL